MLDYHRPRARPRGLRPPHRRTPARAGCPGAAWSSAGAGSSAAIALAILAVFLIPVADFSTGTPRAERAAPRPAPRGRAWTRSTARASAPGSCRPYDVAVVGGDADGRPRRRSAGVDGVRGAVAPTRRSGGAATPRSSTSSRPTRTAPPRSRRVRTVADAQPGEILVGGAVPGQRGLQRRRLRQLHLGGARDHRDHLHPAGAGLPLPAAAAQGDHLQHHLDRRGVGLPRLVSGRRATARGRSSTSSRPGRSRCGSR